MEILNIAIPAVIVFLTAYVLLDRFLKNDEKRRIFELRKNNLSVVTPIRLRAYERLTLFLERTTPNVLIFNVVKPGMNCMQLHTKLLETIRQEYSHNISQQIYVSDTLWNSIAASKESLIKLINMSASRFSGDQPANLLAEYIIQVYDSSDQTPTETTLSLLKQEVGRYF